MSRIKTPFMPDKYFHIYHKVENGRNLFPTEEYKNIFFNALNKIINPYAKIIGYCLLPDHYHLLIKVKSQLYQKMVSLILVNYSLIIYDVLFVIIINLLTRKKRKKGNY